MHGFLNRVVVTDCSVLLHSPGVPDFSLRVALQTLLKEYCEVSKSLKESKVSSFLQPSKARPRRKARKYLYAVGEDPVFFLSILDFFKTQMSVFI